MQITHPVLSHSRSSKVNGVIRQWSGLSRTFLIIDSGMKLKQFLETFDNIIVKRSDRCEYFVKYASKKKEGERAVTSVNRTVQRVVPKEVAKVSVVPKGNPVNGNIVQLLRQEEKIPLSQFRQKYTLKFGELPHDRIHRRGDVRLLLITVPEVRLVMEKNGNNKDEVFVVLGVDEEDNTVKGNIVQLLMQEEKIPLAQFKQKYEFKFGKYPYKRRRKGDLKQFLQTIPKVRLVRNNKDGVFVFLGRKSDGLLPKDKESDVDESSRISKGKGSSVKKEVEPAVVEPPAKSSSKSGDIPVGSDVEVSSISQVSDLSNRIKSRTASLVKSYDKLLRLTDDQARGGTTKYPPGCRVVFDIEESDNDVKFRVGTVVAVFINLSPPSRGQIVNEIKVQNDDSNTVKMNEKWLAFAPQSPVYFQIDAEKRDVAAVTLSLQKRTNDAGETLLVYSILIEDMATIKLNVGLNYLSDRSVSGKKRECSADEGQEHKRPKH